MTWTGPAFVDHHVHLLRVAAGETGEGDPYTPRLATPDPAFAGRMAAFHRRIQEQGTTPMDALDPIPVTGAALVEKLAHGLQRAAGLGLAQVTEAGMAGWDYYDALQRLRERGPLPVRVKLLVASGFARPDMPKGVAQDLEVIGVKFYGDGWLGPRTCAVCQPFADGAEADTGILFQDAATLARRAAPFAEAGFTIATHCIGDRAIEAALDAYAQIYGADCAAAGPRIEHAQLLRRDLIDRIAAMGVVACVQPSFAVSDAPARAAALGDRWPLAYRWDELIAAGARVIAGSDFPIETLAPLWNLQRLVTGADIGSEDVVSPALGIDDALAIMTDAGAGTTTLAADPHTVDPHDLHRVEVVGSTPR